MMYQNDKKWKSEQMAMRGDTIGKYGCLVTSLVNIYNMHFNKKISVKEFNKKIVDKKGYEGLHRENCPENRFSFLHWPTAEKIFKYTNKKEVKLSDIKYNTNKYYIVKIDFFGGGHYINMTEEIGAGNYKCFDVWDASTKVVSKKQIRKVIEIGF